MWCYVTILRDLMDLMHLMEVVVKRHADHLSGDEDSRSCALGFKSATR